VAYALQDGAVHSVNVDGSGDRVLARVKSGPGELDALEFSRDGSIVRVSRRYGEDKCYFINTRDGTVTERRAKDRLDALRSEWQIGTDAFLGQDLQFVRVVRTDRSKGAAVAPATATRPVGLPQGGKVERNQTTDLDGDGTLETAYFAAAQGGHALWVEKDQAVVWKASDRFSSDYYWVYCMDTIDVDGDGRPEICIFQSPGDVGSGAFHAYTWHKGGFTPVTNLAGVRPMYKDATRGVPAQFAILRTSSTGASTLHRYRWDGQGFAPTSAGQVEGSAPRAAAEAMHREGFRDIPVDQE
ncbi:MAG TPA: VCBS repeat-containing protein, partial [Chloroflexota bacterium]|nr:VCBS repeat-containing protein [Chloroflexota bacterium]